MSGLGIVPTRRTVLKLVGGALAAGGATGTAAAGDHDGARLRVVHAVPDAPDVDIYVDGDEVLSDVPFGEASDYLDLEPGEYDAAVVPAGEARDEAVIDSSVDLGDGDYTAAAIGELDDDVELLVLEDDNSSTKFDAARLRVVHASPDAPDVDVTTEVELADYASHLGFPRVALKLTLADDLAFGDATDYRGLGPGEYPVDVREEDEDDRGDRVFDADLEVEGDVAYTVFAVGYVDPDDDGDDGDDASFDLLVAAEET